MFNIVLFEPEIPNNTGNIGRLALATGCHLHLVKPLGFELDDKRVKRAGLDYWPHLSLSLYANKEEFLDLHKNKPMAFFSSHGTKTYWSLPYEAEHFLIFGKESVGLDSEIKSRFADQTYQIPLYNDKIRSLNLANSVSVVVYEGIRSLQA